MPARDFEKDIPPNYVREWRELVGITVTELAARSGMDKTVISKIENGKRSLDLNDINRIAFGLNVEPYFLLLSTDQATYIWAAVDDLHKSAEGR